LIDAGDFVDRRAAEPIVYIPEDEDSEAVMTVIGGEISEHSESAPSFTYTPRHYTFPDPPDYDITPPEKAEPYPIEIWVEKSTMGDVLEPIARRYGVTLITCVGELSLTRVRRRVAGAQNEADALRARVFTSGDVGGSA
jgi:hypothetical protein